MTDAAVTAPPDAAHPAADLPAEFGAGFVFMTVEPLEGANEPLPLPSGVVLRGLDEGEARP